MFRPVKMSKVNILLLSKHVTEITEILGRRGLVHLVDAVKQSRGKLLGAVDSESEEKSAFELLRLCERLMEGLGVELNAELPKNNADMTLDEIKALLNRIYDAYHEAESSIDKLLESVNATDHERSTIAAFPLQDVNGDVFRNLSHFYMVTGHIEANFMQRAMMELSDRALILEGGNKDGDVLVISSSRNRWAVKDQLDKYGFAESEVPFQSGTAADAVKEKDRELHDLRERIEACRLDVLKLSERYGAVLLYMHQHLKGLTAIHEAQKHFGRSAQLFCISGWTPTEQVETVRGIVNETTGGTGVVEVTEAEEDEMVKEGLESVPIKFADHRLLRPFQLLVSNFGMPQYHEIDPSPFVGLTFILLFGYMFGDIGQGLVLGLIGLWLLMTKRKVGALARDAGVMLTGCGLSAMLFGFFYGSFFGYENHEFLKPLWLSPLKEADILKLLTTAVGVGIVFSSVAIIINIVNHFTVKKYFEGVFDRFGVLGLLFYWFALGSGVVVMKTKHFPCWLLLLILLPLVLLFLRGPLRRYVFKKQRKAGEDDEEEKEGLIEMFLEACIELMETFTGYISGTVSFVRIGAFAISHAALCLAVYSIVSMVSKAPGGTLMSIVVIVLGNALVTAFEGMVVMIQGVRLEYYELFGKYFSGGGVEYRPFTLEEKEEDK